MIDYGYIISEINVNIANLERLKRGLEQEQRQAHGQPAAQPPSRVEYDRDLLDTPPRAVQPEEKAAPKCHCGLPAEFKKSAPQSPKQWSAYFCARPKSDPRNCGFKQWLD